MNEFDLPFRTQFPKLIGFGEGSLAALGAVGLLAVVGGTTAAWPLIVVGMLGYRRSLSYQVAALLPSAVIYMVLGDIIPRNVFVPLAAGLALANMLPQNDTSRRWSSEHCLYAMALVIGFFPVSLVMRGTGNLVSEVAQTFLLCAVMIGILTGVAAVRMVCRMIRGEEPAPLTPSERLR